MKIKLIHNINDFKKLKNHWDDIYKKNEYTIFQSFTFNYASWKYDLSISKINKLQIVLILKQDEIISIMPFYLDFKKKPHIGAFFLYQRFHNGCKFTKAFKG